MHGVRYLTVQEIIAVNVAPQASAFEDDAYKTIYEKVAALFESLGQNHPFQNGNKRTAFTALVIFLRYNGFPFSMDKKAAEDFTVDMVNHKYTFGEITGIIRKCSRS